MNPCFSIIVPVYNTEPYLRECLDSVLNQTFTDWECICVDDGSTDGSGKILDEYQSKDKRFKIFHSKKTGVANARNMALSVRSGEWFLFLDSDDMISEKSLSVLNKCICNYPEVNLFRFGYEYFKEKPTIKLNERNSHFNLVDISKNIQHDDIFVYAWQFLYRSSSLEDNRFPSYLRGEDRVFIVSLLLQNDSFVLLDDKLYFYRQRPLSAMTSQPTFQVLLDEMRHRCDIVLMLENSSKSISYASSGWLVQYFIHFCPELIDRYAIPSERQLLWKEWRRCVSRMRKIAGVSLKTRMLYQFCSILPCNIFWYKFIYRMFNFFEIPYGFIRRHI